MHVEITFNDQYCSYGSVIADRSKKSYCLTPLNDLIRFDFTRPKTW